MHTDTQDAPVGRETLLGYRVGTKLNAAASFGADFSPGRLVQLSLEHLTLHLDSRTVPRKGQAASVVVGEGERWATALDAEVIGVNDARPEVSLRFVAPPLDAGRRIVGLLESLRDNGLLLTPETRPVWREHIDRADRVARICEALASRQARGVLRTQDGQRVEVTASFFEPLQDMLGWKLHGALPPGPFTVEAFGYSSVVHFQAESARVEGDLLVMPVPTSLVRFRHRWLRRTQAAASCTLDFDHPLWPQVHVSRGLLDVSYEGLSFLTEPGEDLMYPGLRLPVMEVALEGYAPVRLRAEVRNISSTPHGRRCGVCVRPLDAEGARAWRALVEAQAHPTTKVEGDWNDSTWKLFERSGYFRLPGKEPEKFTNLREQFDHTQDKLQEQPRLGYRVVRPADEGVEATLSVLKPYAGSWMAHQLARHQPPNSKSTAREALRDIYLRGYEPTQADPEVKWFFAYCEANVRWVRYTKFDFANWYSHTGQTCLVPFRLMEGEVDSPWAVPAGIALDTPTEEERTRFFEQVASTRPEAYREALDLVPERFDLSQMRTGWGEAGLSRERELVVARHNGRAVALAVFESAQPGLNLFNVLDGVRLVPLEDDARPEVQEAFVALLGRAADWYRARDRKVFVHYVEATCVEYAERVSLADLGEGKLWVMSARLLPEFLEHLCESTTPRAA
ncbi:PilZ domain-containing protein [Corallococcus llansteffanensis]|uniref:PilZ domain-containing protein n=1 Tax=Corallococcus llansteffanensis TaxID=2316731 RepID=A0A3A8QCX1_9BACT|nr:PilZ domain-containing protein [Corallococcus llansteffanensis]RKH62632.1 PilZ domain-containing protein [Corallococcus llansteffanensis]